MLIRLLPVPPSPSVLLTVTFPTLPQDLPFPPGWTAQLQCAAADELEMPVCAHALDKAGWAVSLIHEVTFDMSSQSVSCLFVDGSREEWLMTEEQCIRKLDSVIQDVDLGAKLDEMGEARAASPPVVVPAPAPIPVKPSKHKKQRSLLMTLVASLVPLPNFNPPPPQAPEVRPPSPESRLPSTPTVPSSELSRSGRFFRRRARATLVDTYRRHVLSEITVRTSSDGYCSWIAQSMLRRVELRMSALIEEAGGNVPDLLPSDICRSSSTVSSNPFFDDDEEGLSVADTDDSSLHTPRDSLTEHMFQWRQDNSCSLPRSPSPPVCKEDIEEYTALHAQSLRLRQLFLRMEAAERNTASEKEALLSVLEVKSKRRAWLNCSLLGRASMHNIGLGTPYRSSPLARFDPVTPQGLAPPQFLNISTGTHDVSTLFPLVEGESEDYFPQDVVCDGPSPALPLEVPRIRTRTKSINRAPLDLDLGTSPDPPTLFVPPPPQYKSVPTTLRVVDRSDATAQDPCSVPMLVFDGGCDGGCDEFTLALDVNPFPRRHGVGQRASFERPEWLMGPVVDCR